jgi:CheY-like chemotaxis protein
MADQQAYSSEKRISLVKRVLVVEDDMDFGSVLVRMIQQETPYQALLATTGIEALNIVSHLYCDVFVLDYHLPYMNGLELYDRLHATAGQEATPALFLSASTRLPLDEITQRHLKYIYKPVELDNLLETLQEFLGLEEQKHQ